MSTSQMSTNQMSTSYMSTNQMSTSQMSTNQISTNQISTSHMSTNQMSTNQMSTSLKSHCLQNYVSSSMDKSKWSVYRGDTFYVSFLTVTEIGLLFFLCEMFFYLNNSALFYCKLHFIVAI